MIAALYVQTGGVYYDPELTDVDPWDEERDARFYRGPHPVVAHPPCARWGRYWSGGPSARIRRLRGDDAGCFAHALWAVRTFGGVIEHPAASSAWRWYGLSCPLSSGGWFRADEFGGLTCHVEQGHYGHRARKATWLYAVGCCTRGTPALRWGPSSGERLEDGFHSTAERTEARARGVRPVERLSSEERLATPIPFRDTLINLARSVSKIDQQS